MDLSAILKYSDDILDEIINASSSERLTIFDTFYKKLDPIVFNFGPGSDYQWLNTEFPLTNKQLEGKIVLLDFWTYCCINCIHILPHIKALEKKFTCQDGFLVLGIQTPKFENEKNFSNFKNAVERLGIEHVVLNDSNGCLWTHYGISCWPTQLVLGPSNEILLNVAGEGRQAEIEMFIETALRYFKNLEKINTKSLNIGPQFKNSFASVLKFPGKIAMSGENEKMAVSDSGNHQILILNFEGKILDTIGGNGRGYKNGSFQDAQFNNPQGLTFLRPNLLIIADTDNHTIRQADLTSRKVVTLAGTSEQGHDTVGGKEGPQQILSSPWDIIVVSSKFCQNTEKVKIDIEVEKGLNKPPPPPPPMLNHEIQLKGESKEVLLIAMAGIHQIWGYFFDDTLWWNRKFEKGSCAALVGSGIEENRNNSYPLKAGFAQPSGLAYDSENGFVFVADSESSSVRKIDLKNGAVSGIVGGNNRPDDLFSFGDEDDVGIKAKLQHPLDVCWSAVFKTLFVCDSYNNKIKRVDPKNKSCSFVKEIKGLNEPGGICVFGPLLFIVDTNNHMVKKFNIEASTLIELEVEKTSANFSRKLVEIFASISSDCEELTIIFKSGTTGQFKITKSLQLILPHKKCLLENNELKIKFIFNSNETLAEIEGDLDLATCENLSCKLHRIALNIKLIKTQTDPNNTVYFKF